MSVPARLKAMARVTWINHFKLRHRKIAYQQLRGKGLEVGAFYSPAGVPKSSKMTYADSISSEDALLNFPELRFYPLVHVDRIVNLDLEGLSGFQDSEFDFFIMNHVIEHVANPIRVIEEIFRVVKKSGHIVITAPDKEYNAVDSRRAMTSFEHVLNEYKKGINEVTDDHYLDLLKGLDANVMSRSPQDIQTLLNGVRARREHAHVWDSPSFKDFFLKACEELHLSANLLYESSGKENLNEYFSLWQKT